MTWELRQADCLEAMREMDEASVDAVVCDPPYGLEFMGKEWDDLGKSGVQRKAEVGGGDRRAVVDADEWAGGESSPYSRSRVRWQHGAAGPRAMQEWHQAWATEALRVLKPGGFLLAAGGTRTFHRLVSAIEDAGFEIRDCIAHMFGSGFPKSHNGEWGGTALKPSFEPWTLARKPLIGTVEENWRRFGTGALNVDACRILSGQRPTLNEWEQWPSLCDSCAEDVGENPKLEPPATRECSAPSPAALTMNARDEKLPRDSSKTATGCSDGQFQAGLSTDQSDDTSLSIDGSGKNTTQATSLSAVSSTTSTGTSSTTGLRTCTSCGAAITRDTTSASNGRWPSNTALSHLPECEAVGTRRVRGSFIEKPCPDPEIRGHKWGTMQGNRGPRGHGDPDGLETVTEWACAESCPVAELDRQSGERPGFSGGARNNAGFRREYAGGKREKCHACTGTGRESTDPEDASLCGECGGTGNKPTWNDPEPNYFGDTGGASRFFYVAKASRAERTAGVGANAHPT